MITTISFEKYTGAGNDFVIIEDVKNLHDDEFYQNIAALLCDRNFGIGGDGLMVIRSSDSQHFKMMYWNSDGSIAGMCGNGGRCISMMYHRYFQKKEFSFETRSGIYSSKILDDQTVELTMINPFDFIDETPLSKESGYVNTGTQHIVIFESKIESLNVFEIGRNFRNSEFALSKGGANINFVEVSDSHSIKVRTYEKGVEAETLACGTGTVASAILAFRKNKVHKKPIEVTVKSGEKLLVDFDQNYQNVILTGQAKFLFSGEIKINHDSNHFSIY